MSDIPSSEGDAPESASHVSRVKQTAFLNAMIQSTGARTISLLGQALCAILITRLVIGSFGLETYGFVIVIVGIPLLIGFADLGVGAAITNSISQADPDDTVEVSQIVTTAIRTLVIGAICITGLVIAAYGLGLWSKLLGIPDTEPLNANLAVTLTLLPFALSLPLNVGGSLLLGAGLNGQLILLRSIQPPATLILLWFMISAGSSPNFLPVCWQLGALLSTITVCVVAQRRTGVRIFRTIWDVARRKAAAGAAIGSTAVPWLIISVSLPLAMQSDRIILSNRSGLGEVANYSIVSTIQGPILALISAAGLSMWPHFSKERNSGESGRAAFTLALRLFFVTGLVASVALYVVGPYLVPLVTKGQASIDANLFASASLVVLVVSCQNPAGMFLTDSSGLAFQAKTVSLMAVVNVALSWVLAGKYGASGPYLGTAIAIAVCQLGPTIWVALKKTQR